MSKIFFDAKLGQAFSHAWSLFKARSAKVTVILRRTRPN
jgi:hypothetical protein